MESAGIPVSSIWYWSFNVFSLSGWFRGLWHVAYKHEKYFPLCGCCNCPLQPIFVVDHRCWDQVLSNVRTAFMVLHYHVTTLLKWKIHYISRFKSRSTYHNVISGDDHGDQVPDFIWYKAFSTLCTLGTFLMHGNNFGRIPLLTPTLW